MKTTERFSFNPRKINIKWKLTISAAVLILTFFLSYNLLQYFIIQNWGVNQEKQRIQKNMDEVFAYIKETNPQKNIAQNESYLDTLNEKYQMIRIVQKNNKPLFTISDEVPQSLVPPKHVNKEDLSEGTPEGERLLIYRKPINVNGFNGTIEIVRNMENFDSLIHLFFITMIIAGIGSIVISLFAGRLISFILLKPIKAIILTMKKIKEHGLTERVPIPPNHDEMTELGIMFNDLMNSLEKSFHQQQQFVADASHELKTPLSVIHGHLSLINRWGKEDPKVLERSLQLSLNETNRLIRLVSELLELSKAERNGQEKMIVEEIKLGPVLHDIIENFKIFRNDFTINLSSMVDETTTVRISKRHLEEILIILLDNSMKYSKEKKLIEIHVSKMNENLDIAVKDYGVGIPEEDLPFVLNRFYRVDKARSRKFGGNGLGLSIAKRLVEMYKGNIYLESVYGKWTEVTVVLPLNPKY
ncbi:HAMP domain-containing sensor histidine kinase [Heyndrickxia sp. NPDC080065]|uniref:HAMP domain-containing sensor histidine kinase n=1 Tax=Heyndrickxia sp. NPDC080065 TaxID=3390568 RepID=UPI003CFF668C